MEAREARMRRHHLKLTQLSRSDTLRRGELEGALHEVTEAACTTLGVARSGVWFYDETRTRIECVDLYQWPEAVHSAGTTLLAAEHPAYFAAIAAERTIAAHDAHTHAATSEFSAGYLTPLGIRSMLDAPIVVAGHMVGVVCQEHIGELRQWEIDEEQFTGSLADIVAMALESSKRRAAQEQLQAAVVQLERQLRQLNGMLDVSRTIIAVLDVDAVLGTILDLSREVMAAEASALLLCDGPGGALRFHLASGAAQHLKDVTVERGRGPAGWVAERGEPLLIADAYTDPRFDPHLDERTGFRMRSLLSVPLRTKDEILGVLEVANPLGRRSFDEEDLALFQSFANMAAISIDNGRLFTKTRQMADDLRDALEQERRLTIEKEKMGAYIPKYVVDEIARNREQKLALGGKTVHASVLFSDIQGFTALSERMRPENVVAFLNEYMTAMTGIIEAEGGIVDKFIGDGIMAVFLPTGEHDNHALRAVRAGIQMQEELTRIQRRWMATRPEVSTLQTRIGINSGEMLAGNVGSETRMEFTVIGDNVNVASRIEANGVGGQVIISEATQEQVREHVRAFRLEPITVKNRVQPVSIYAVEIPSADSAPDELARRHAAAHRRFA